MRLNGSRPPGRSPDGSAGEQQFVLVVAGVEHEGVADERRNVARVRSARSTARQRSSVTALSAHACQRVKLVPLPLRRSSRRATTSDRQIDAERTCSREGSPNYPNYGLALHESLAILVEGSTWA